MKNHVLAVLRSVSLVGVLSCAVICPVYAQGVRGIGSNTPVNSDSPVVKATNAVIQLSIRITEPGNYRLNTNLVGITPNAVIEIDSSNVTLDLNGFSIEAPGTAIIARGANIAILNGSISVGDGRAVLLIGSNCRIEQLRVGKGRFGFDVRADDGDDAGTGCILKNNTVRAAVVGISCNGCVLSGNAVTAVQAINAFNSSLVLGNRVIGGQVALQLDNSTGYAQNVLRGGEADVIGGVQIGENLCATSTICSP